MKNILNGYGTYIIILYGLNLNLQDKNIVNKTIKIEQELIVI